MDFITLFLFAVGLCFDSFAVSLSCGMSCCACTRRRLFRFAAVLGLSQGLMPLIGWAVATNFRTVIEAYDHWIAFALLLFLGGKMIKDGLSKEEDFHHFNPRSLRTQILLSVATSIDALAVGISFACLGYSCVSQLAVPLAIIGFVSFAMAVLGNALGARFGCIVAKRLKPDVVGGVILLVIGVKILVTHLWVQQ